MPVLDGRLFDGRDRRDTAKVLIVNHALVTKYLAGEQPVGRIADVWGEKRTIIGVVGDVKDTPSDAEAHPAYWFPHAQVTFPTMSLVIRTNTDPEGLAGLVRQVLHARDRELALAQIETLDNIARAANGQAVSFWRSLRCSPGLPWSSRSLVPTAF